MLLIYSTSFSAYFVIVSDYVSPTGGAAVGSVPDKQCWSTYAAHTSGHFMDYSDTFRVPQGLWDPRRTIQLYCKCT